jgi:thermolysin
MTSTLGFRIVVPFVALAAGCQAQPTVVDGGPLDPLAQLEADTGASWSVRWQTDVHTPAFMEGRTPPMAATPADARRAGRAFFMKYHSLFGLDGPGDDLLAVDAETDELGMTHARFRQKRGRVAVEGGELVAHFDAGGALVRLNGRVVPVPELALEPQLSADEARVAATVDARVLRPDVDASAFTTRVPDLVVLPLDGGRAQLAWRVEVSCEDPAGPLELVSFADAVTGSILAHEEQTDSVDASGTGVNGDVKKLEVAEKRGSFWLEDATRGGLKTYSARGKSTLPGTEVHSKDPQRWDTDGPAAGAAVDAHVYAGVAWDYFLNEHKRRGFDNKAVGPHVVVHYGTSYENAYWDGRELVFGDGGATLGPTASALDVVAHEFTHGVTGATAKLGHSGQGGALNEGVSDVFGCLIAGTKWQVGASIYHPNGHPRAMRDLAHPHASGNPEKMSEYQDTQDDQGGVHVNSTIPSHAAYLMSKSLSSRDVGRVWYRALAHYLHAKAGFADAADATTAAAHDLGLSVQPVHDAWVAVGVVE